MSIWKFEIILTKIVFTKSIKYSIICRMIVDKQKMALDELQEKIDVIFKCIDKNIINKELENLKKEQEAPDFWENLANAQKINKQIKHLENKLEIVKNIEKQKQYILELIDLLGETDDEDMLSELDNELEKLKKYVEKTFLTTLLSDKYDENNAIFTIHSGAGGTESQDWASMLYRMYTRFAERNGFACKVMDLQEGDVVGIKSVTVLMSGDNAYGYLKCEKGVHRLVRISPFDSNARRHTSFASVDVMPEIEDDGDIVIDDKDIKIDTYRSSGAGGQNVNKTESAIRITHLPTGIVVNCQIERSQMQNKATAFQMLRAKLAALKQEQEEAKRKDIQGELKKIEWGSQIRSYVFCPYTMVKDHRTDHETPNIDAVMDGDILDFINSYLTLKNMKKQ